MDEYLHKYKNPTLEPLFVSVNKEITEIEEEEELIDINQPPPKPMKLPSTKESYLINIKVH